MPLLMLGGIGSTIYHAFRTSYFFLLMDVVPIAMLTIMVGIYFWWKVIQKWSYVAIISLVFITLRFVVYNEITLGRQGAINISYFITGLMIFVPAFLLLLKTNYHGVLTLIAAAFLFVVSLMFRQIDTPFFFMPMGTHWLWHVTCAAGAYFLGQYLYLIANLQEERVNA
jgi:hemolysin III